VRTGLEIDVSASSEDSDAGPVLGDLGPVRQSLVLDLRQSFAEGPDGEGLVMTTVGEDVRMETEVAGTPRALPDGILRGLRGLTVESTMDRKGRRAAVEESGGPPAAAEPAGVVEELAPSLPTLPDDPLKIGDSFISEAEARLPAAGVLGEDAPVSVAATYTLRGINGNRAVFDVTTEVAPAEREEAPPFRVDGAGSGTAEFDLESGYFVEVSLRQLVTVELDGPPALSLDLELDISTMTEPIP
jgi:hypothetical protein